MKDFDYIQPETAKDAARFLEGPGWTNERARAFAGGQDLYGEMKTGLVAPGALVNLKAFEDGVEGQVTQLAGGNLSLGALVRLSALCALPGDSAQAKMLREAAVTVASPQVRSRATLGGNLCQRPRCLYYRRPEALCLKKGGDEWAMGGGPNSPGAAPALRWARWSRFQGRRGCTPASHRIATPLRRRPLACPSCERLYRESGRVVA